MTEWIGEDTKDVGDEFKQLNERIKTDNQKHVEETIDYLKGDSGESHEQTD